MDQLSGQSLGRYQIINLLGEGGMGAVYKGRDAALQRDVAVKVLHDQFARQTNFQERFLQEARVAARLDHPGIVKVFDFGTTNGRLYIVMEFIPGPNLNQLLRTLRTQRQWIILPEAIAMVRQIALALDYAHRQSVLHRDIKPSNIMLKPADDAALPYQPIITDLGLAKLGAGAGLTQTGSSMGTPAYMSPEQALGEETDARSDVYSLGILLYELAVSRLPFPAATPSAAIRYHTKETPPAPASIRPDIPPTLAQIILRALAKQPSARFATAADLAQALAALPAETIVATVPPLATAGASSMMTQYQQSLLELHGPSILDKFPVAGPGPARLQVLTPDGAARTVAFDKRVLTVGRANDNDLALDDVKISRHHVRIEFDGTEYRVTDLNSANGVYLGQVKLLPDVPQSWPVDKPLRVGNHHLRLAPTQPGSNDMNAATYTSQASAGTSRIGLFCEIQALTVKPGERATLPVILINQGPQVDHFIVTIDGVTPTWVQMPPPAPLMPGEQREVTLTFQPPRTPHSRAGDYPLTLRVSSRSVPDLIVTRQLNLRVESFSGSKSELSPQEAAAGKPLAVKVENQGNMPQVYQLSWQDRANELVFEPAVGQLQVQPGETATLAFQARPQQRHWIGGAKQHSVAIRVGAAGEQAQQHTATVVSHALVPAWVPIVLLALLVVGIAWATSVLRERTTQTAASVATATAVQALALVTQTAQAQTDLNAVQAATATALWLDGDDDRDGLSNRQELERKTLPATRDTDQDGIDDGEEVNKWLTNPLVADSDGDGLKDGDEVQRGINPMELDTDGDGIQDAADPDPGHVPTPTPNAAATAALIATQTAVAQAAMAATATVQAQQAADATAAAQAAIDTTATAQAILQAAANATVEAIAQQAAAAATATADVIAQQTAEAQAVLDATATAQADLAQQAADATATALATNQFVASWVNVDPNTDGMTQLIITSIDPNTVSFQGFGACSPTDCDWGLLNVPYTPPTVVGTYDFGWKTTKITVQLSGEHLLVETFDDYTQADGREDRTSNYEMMRQ